MVGNVKTIMLHGISGVAISIECDVSEGLPSFQMVGYLAAEVREAKERVMAGMRNVGYKMPVKKITVNLMPASIHKTGTSFDVPIAVALGCAYGYIKANYLDSIAFVGEISLKGKVQPVQGILPMILAAKKMGYKACVVPFDNLEEALLVDDIAIIGVRDMAEVFLELQEKELTSFCSKYETKYKKSEKIEKSGEKVYWSDFSRIKGQKALKRACEVAASGMHNLLMVGPPGTGKSMIAEAFSGIMPELTPEEKLEVFSVYSICGCFENDFSLMNQRPFRRPHHKSTAKGLLGGGNPVRPGEISLANHGVMFLDELAEFATSTLEALRQPIEERKVHVVRATGTYTFPADFCLVAAMNPCPCGYFPDLNRCRCTQTMIHRYLGKVSGPMLDRFDLCIQVREVQYEQLRSHAQEESSLEIRKRVEKCHIIQRRRFADESILFNSQMNIDQIEKFCKLTDELETYMKSMFEKLHLTARSYHRILKVARTIADMRESMEIERCDLDEALLYRNMVKTMWES